MRRRVVCSLAFALLSLGGCIQPPVTSLERARSFAPLAGSRVGSEPLDEHLRLRTLVLLGGIPHGAAHQMPTSSLAEAMLSLQGRCAVGSATAIDPRGYLLTAAHCVDWPRLHVLLGQHGGRVRLVPARVVWRGDASTAGSDLAVIAIDTPLPDYFRWTEGVGPGQVAVGVGPEYEAAAGFRLACFSGAILKLEPRAGGDHPHTVLYHSGPVHEGDSGGPLVTPEGQLLGINVGDIHEYHLLRFAHRKAARAHRPDLARLGNLIERDFALKRSAGSAAF